MSAACIVLHTRAKILAASSSAVGDQFGKRRLRATRGHLKPGRYRRPVLRQSASIQRRSILRISHDSSTILRFLISIDRHEVCSLPAHALPAAAWKDATRASRPMWLRRINMSTGREQRLHRIFDCRCRSVHVPRAWRSWRAEMDGRGSPSSQRPPLSSTSKTRQRHAAAA